MFSFVGDTILDPFLGSGTTSLAVRELNRNSVGYEINPEFIPVISEKLVVNQHKIFDDAEFKFLKQDKLDIDFQKEIEKQPYIFKDPVKLDKKVDPKKLQFGSKIDKNSREREEYYTVKEIKSPEILVLNTGLNIRLIGIKEDDSKNGRAIDYLTRKLKGKKVFIKLDQCKHDKKNNLLCYLYLKNKTFINAHLLKNDLTNVDDSYDFKLKNSFINYKQSVNGKRMGS